MAICDSVPVSRLGLPGNRAVRLASVVPGMGWLSAVGVAQQAHRRALEIENQVPRAPAESWRHPQDLAPVFKQSLEVRKDRAFPLASESWAAWAVYIDNLT